jgi:hypothetical protein
MNYIDALKEYNKGKSKWCIPRKGSVDYIKIRKMIVDSKYSQKQVSTLNRNSEGHNFLSNSNKRITNNLSKPEPKAEPKTESNPESKAGPKTESKPTTQSSKSSSQITSTSSAPLSLSSKSISKKSKSIIDRISEKPKLKKSSSPFIIDKKARVLQKFFKKYALNDKYTLDNRVKYYNYVINYIKDIKKSECIKKYVENDVTKYTIANKLFLIKKIGSDSITGVIYLTVIKNILGGYLLASKLTPVSKANHTEIEIMKNLTENFTSKKKSRHFLIMYKFFECPRNKLDISKSKRLISINELAHGDLKTLIQDRTVIANDELMYNIFIQTFLSITSFHNLTNYYHKDTHYGNFLYQKNNEVGYYHYKFNNTSYYLKSCIYTIMIYDFGNAKPFKGGKRINKNAIQDYITIITAFMNKNSGWGKYSNLPSDDINDAMVAIKEELTMELDRGNKDNILEDVIYNIILKSLEKRYPKFNIFTTNEPSKIINKIPFLIG